MRLLLRLFQPGVRGHQFRGSAASSLGQHAEDLLLDDREALGREEVVLDRLEEDRLDDRARGHDRVVADALPAVAPAAAPVALRLDDDELAPADPADQQSGEEILRPPTGPRIDVEGRADRDARLMNSGLPRLDALPQGLVDDPQMLRRLPDPLPLVAQEVPLPAGLGVVFPSRPVPDDFTFIEGVVQEPQAVLRIAVQGRGTPGRCEAGLAPEGHARRGDALTIQRLNDLHGTHPVGVLLEHASDDAGLGLTWCRCVPVGRRRPS
jgi:hypothetical protein